MHGNLTIKVADQPSPVEVILSESGQWQTGHEPTQRLLDEQFPASGPEARDDAFLAAAEHLRAVKVWPAGGHPYRPAWADEDAAKAAPPPPPDAKAARPAEPPRPPRGRGVSAPPSQ